MKIVASGPITSLQIDGEMMETVTDFIFLGSKFTVDGDCSMKSRLLGEILASDMQKTPLSWQKLKRN